MEMPPHLFSLAEAVADGQPADWDAAVSSAADSNESAIVAQLRAIAAIGHLYSTVTTLESLISLDSVVVPQKPVPLSGSGADAYGADLPSWGWLRLIERIGRGRFGDVYRAWDPTLRREVALKLLRHRDRGPQAVADAVVEEGRLMARIHHPNVVTIYGAQRIDGRTGLWMELVKGRTLEAEFSARGPLPITDLIAIGTDLARALTAVHDAGLVHRDVKAQNVLREDGGRTVLGDFGTGRESEGDDVTTNTLAGTPAYLAPEIFDGVPASRRSDIYSLGALLYRLATGRYPIAGRTMRELREAHAARDRVSVRVFRPDLSKVLGDAIDRALASDPDSRFENAAVFADVLTSSIRSGVQKERSRLPMWIASAAVFLAASLVIAAGVASGRFPGFRIPVNIRARAYGERSANGRNLRQISQNPDLSGPGAPSPDGHLLSYTDWSTGDLAIQDLDTGKQWHVTSNVPSQADRGWAETSRFANDSSGIFYVWYETHGNQRLGEIRWSTVAGGNSRTIWRAPADASIYLQHWAGDDRVILIGIEERASDGLFALSTKDGRVSRLADTGPLRPYGASLSPDAQYIAYDRPDPSSGNRDIHVASVDGQFDSVVINDPANDHTPVWTNDGRHLLFLSDRSGPTGLWAQRVDGVRPVGQPVRIEPNLGWSFFMGLTADGNYFLRRQMGTRDVYVAQLDPGSEIITRNPIRVSLAGAGANGTSDWSPDGQRLAFFRRYDDRRRLVIKSLTTGDEHEIVNHEIDGVARPRWEAGGRSLLFKGTYHYQFGLYRLALDSEAVSTVMVTDNFNDYELLPDGRSIIYSNRSRREFVRRDLTTGQEAVVHRSPGSPYGLAVARAGDRFAYVIMQKDKGTTLVVVDLSNPASARPIFHVGSEEGLTPYVFTADGEGVIVARAKTVHAPENDETALWTIDLKNGEARKIGLNVNGLQEVRLSPEGRRVSYDGGWPLQEVWSLDNAMAGLN